VAPWTGLAKVSHHGSKPEPIELITEVDAAADKIVSALGFPR
jgi:hypothetical protein